MWRRPKMALLIWRRWWELSWWTHSQWSGLSAALSWFSATEGGNLKYSKWGASGKQNFPSMHGGITRPSSTRRILDRSWATILQPALILYSALRLIRKNRRSNSLDKGQSFEISFTFLLGKSCMRNTSFCIRLSSSLKWDSPTLCIFRTLLPAEMRLCTYCSQNPRCSLPLSILLSKSPVVVLVPKFLSRQLQPSQDAFDQVNEIATCSFKTFICPLPQDFPL